MATRYYVAAFHTHANVRAWLIDPGFIFLRGDENLAIYLQVVAIHAYLFL